MIQSLSKLGIMPNGGLSSHQTETLQGRTFSFIKFHFRASSTFLSLPWERIRAAHTIPSVPTQMIVWYPHASLQYPLLPQCLFWTSELPSLDPNKSITALCMSDLKSPNWKLMPASFYFYTNEFYAIRAEPSTSTSTSASVSDTYIYVYNLTSQKKIYPKCIMLVQFLGWSAM